MPCWQEPTCVRRQTLIHTHTRAYIHTVRAILASVGLRPEAVDRLMLTSSLRSGGGKGDKVRKGCVCVFSPCLPSETRQGGWPTHPSHTTHARVPAAATPPLPPTRLRRWQQQHQRITALTAAIVAHRGGPAALRVGRGRDQGRAAAASGVGAGVCGRGARGQGAGQESEGAPRDHGGAGHAGWVLLVCEGGMGWG